MSSSIGGGSIIKWVVMLYKTIVLFFILLLGGCGNFKNSNDSDYQNILRVLQSTELISTSGQSFTVTKFESEKGVGIPESNIDYKWSKTVTDPVEGKSYFLKIDLMDLGINSDEEIELHTVLK
ncbi:hypothetical protein DID78_03860 [Candidatus Marinamargulisbacteria bacterium SCGC AG-343-D04]|nr:hypothetical protein DID78_03860 [Candidatus Marinamargulisbacteria bacterium SCGC AG-343-D04]